MPKTALVAGFTGLVGRHLLDGLIQSDHYAEIKAVGRHAPAASDDRLRYLRSDLNDPKRLGATLAADDAFCCLGTTLKSAGSRAAFERVDFHMVVEFARAAHANGARRFFLVSSLSAAPKSRVFYSRVKGRAEEAVTAIGFDALHILRPSLLLGERKESRIVEKIAQKLSPIFNPLLIGPLRSYRAIGAQNVAQAMLRLADGEDVGNFVHTLPLPE